jgi:hypothetical protein
MNFEACQGKAWSFKARKSQVTPLSLALIASHAESLEQISNSMTNARPHFQQ